MDENHDRTTGVLGTQNLQTKTKRKNKTWQEGLEGLGENETRLLQRLTPEVSGCGFFPYSAFNSRFPYSLLISPFLEPNEKPIIALFLSLRYLRTRGRSW